MPISIRFRLLPPGKNRPYRNPHPIQVRITIDGNEDGGFVGRWPLPDGEKMQVSFQNWKIKKQASSLRSDPVNDQIAAIKAHILAIYHSQKLTTSPTVLSVRYELAEGSPPPYSPKTGWQTKPVASEGMPIPVRPIQTLSEESGLREAYVAYILELRLSPDITRQSKITIGRWERGLFLLGEYQSVHGPLPACTGITLNWLKTYHSWMQTRHGGIHRHQPVSAGQASRFIGKIGTVFDWMIDEGLLEKNPVRLKKWPRPADKEIHYLEPHHIRQLLSLDWDKTKGTVLWWFCLMCVTGMDYPDAKAYAKNRSQFERSTPQGIKISGHRMKPPHEAYELYQLAEVVELFAKHPAGADPLSGQCFNRYTDTIEQELGITWRITAKTARKTFGCLMIAAGYYIAEVSRMLGHRSISITERHYVKVLGSQVDRGRQRVEKNGGSW